MVIYGLWILKNAIESQYMGWGEGSIECRCAYMHYFPKQYFVNISRMTKPNDMNLVSVGVFKYTLQS